MADLTLERIAGLRKWATNFAGAGVPYCDGITPQQMFSLLDAAERGLTSDRKAAAQPVAQHCSDHVLYETGDTDAPDQIKDSNGEVVLGQCRKCGKAECELDEPCAPQPVAAGDVPEWLATAVNQADKMPKIGDTPAPWSTWLERRAAVVWEAVQAELSRRVAEKDKRIAETLAIAEAERISERQERIEYQNSLNSLRVFMNNRSSVLGLNDAVRVAKRCIEENEKQLAAAQAEVEQWKATVDRMEGRATYAEIERDKLREEVSRLTKIIGTLDEGRLASDRELVRLREAGATLEEDIRKMSGIIAKLREEVARLSRPVDCLVSVKFGQESCRYVHEDDFKSERNAREAADKRAEAAEAERDELREAWKFCYAVQTATSIAGTIGKWFASVRGERGGPIKGMFDDPNDAVLAAWRAEKAKVGA